MMFFSQPVLGLPMPSTSGRAMLTLPILAPLADLLPYQYGDLFANILSPTTGALIAMLAIAQVPYAKWLRIVLPIYLALFAISAVAIVVAVATGLK